MQRPSADALDVELHGSSSTPPNGSRLSCGRACTTLAATGRRRRSYPGPDGGRPRPPHTTARGRQLQPLVRRRRHVASCAWASTVLTRSSRCTVCQDATRRPPYRSRSRGHACALDVAVQSRRQDAASDRPWPRAVMRTPPRAAAERSRGVLRRTTGGRSHACSTDATEAARRPRGPAQTDGSPTQALSPENCRMHDRARGRRAARQSRSERCLLRSDLTHAHAA